MIIGKAQYEEYLSCFSTEKVFFSINEGESYIKNAEAESAVLNIGIYDLSNTLKDMKIDEIDSYLRGFYNKVLPIINNKYGGKVDKITAYGIVAVFSDAFKYRNTSHNEIFKDAYYCSKELITTLKLTEYKSKIGLSMGNLSFCQITENDTNYTEITCVGEPIFEAYNLENAAELNEILILEKSCGIIYGDTDLRSGWSLGSEDFYFKGLGLCNVKKIIKI